MNAYQIKIAIQVSACKEIAMEIRKMAHNVTYKMIVRT